MAKANRIVAGAQRDDDAGPQSGSAYVFLRDLGGDDNWGQEQKLTASNAAAGDQFGHVSIDGNTIIVGANTADAPYADSGAAYIFTREGDADGDGVPDEEDECENTGPGEIVDETGCSINDLCPCDDPWRNHGAYVTCVVRAAHDFFRAGLITGKEKGEIISEAARSDCGKRNVTSEKRRGFEIHSRNPFPE